MGGEKIAVLLDASASTDVSWSAMRIALLGLSLNPGDTLTLLGVLHRVTSTFGYKCKLDSTMLNPRIVDQELAKKKDQFYENMQLLKQSASQKGKFKIEIEMELHCGSSRKEVTVKAVKKLAATWIILDREMKKEKKYFMKKLECRISKLKRYNAIVLLRGPIDVLSNETSPKKSPNSNGQVSYDEMIPGDLWEELICSPQEENTLETTVAKSRETYAGGKPLYDTHQDLRDSTIVSGSNFIWTKNSTILFGKQENSLAKMKPAGNKTSVSQNSKCQESTCKAEESCNYTVSQSDQRKQQNRKETGTESSQLEQVLDNSICSVCRNRRPKIACHKDFTYAELYEATEGFSRKNYLSEGGFGSVYEGQLKNGQKVAVKQHKIASLQGEKEFKSEVYVLSQARHQNLVMLLGSCSEGSHRLLVYEYVCNGSLDQHLTKDASMPLTWEKRIQIALGAAKGLEYLHSHNIIHRDMRPNNILITHDHVSMLGDFGLAKTQHDSSDNSVVGTLGYMAPEYAEPGKVSTKTDVYSFGVVLLQLLTGLMTTDNIPGGKSLVGWARPLLKDRNYPDLIDRRIIDSHDFLQLFWMVQLTEKCLSNDPNNRFSMEKVVNTLSSIQNGNSTCIYFSPICNPINSILDYFGIEEDGKGKE